MLFVPPRGLAECLLLVFIGSVLLLAGTFFAFGLLTDPRMQAGNFFSIISGAMLVLTVLPIFLCFAGAYSALFPRRLVIDPADNVVEYRHLPGFTHRTRIDEVDGICIEAAASGRWTRIRLRLRQGCSATTLLDESSANAPVDSIIASFHTLGEPLAELLETTLAVVKK